MLILRVYVSSYAQPVDVKLIDFSMADSIAGLYPGYALKDLKKLANLLTAPLPTEEEKFRAIYRWVCNNIEYDNGLYYRNKRKREKLQDPRERASWNKYISTEMFKTLLQKHRTVCTGYAYLIKVLAEHAGLPCVIVDGYGRTVASNIRGKGNPNHSWNAVQLNSKWYLCDATWSSGYVDNDKRTFVKQFDGLYFLTDPTLFVRNHFPLDTTWTLIPKPVTLHKFLNGPLIYKTAFLYQINPVFPESFDIVTAKGQAVAFRFLKENDQHLDKIELLIKNHGTSNLVHPQLHKDTEGNYYLDHTFKAKGTYTVHVMLELKYMFTYSVKVI